MIRGFFAERTGRPYVQAVVAFPRLRVTGKLSFVLDTGADRTMIMPYDAGLLGVPYESLRGETAIRGVGGDDRHFTEAGGVFLFEPDNRVHVFTLDLAIGEPDTVGFDMPSFIGRDVLNRCRVLLDAPRNRLLLRVVAPDYAT